MHYFDLQDLPLDVSPEQLKRADGSSVSLGITCAQDCIDLMKLISYMCQSDLQNENPFRKLSTSVMAGISNREDIIYRIVNKLYLKFIPHEEEEFHEGFRERMNMYFGDVLLVLGEPCLHNCERHGKVHIEPLDMRGHIQRVFTCRIQYLENLL